MMKVLADARLEKGQYELKWNTAETSNYTIISFKLLQKQKTLISIYDMAGRLVKILANAELQAGTHELSLVVVAEMENKRSQLRRSEMLVERNVSSWYHLQIFL